jgi:rhamnogalacturonyl hydrolase YesR
MNRSLPTIEGGDVDEEPESRPRQVWGRGWILPAIPATLQPIPSTEGTCP